MTNPPLIAIVGRPNVGKSSLFNAVVGKRVSIVDPTPGVTRDRIVASCELEGRHFELMDTGGIGIVDEARLAGDIESQISLALDLASSIIFLVDGRDGVHHLDREIARRLRRLGKPILLGVNKIDHPNREHLAQEFHELGLGEPVPISAIEGIGLLDLVTRALDVVGSAEADETEGDVEEGLLKIAIVGKRNVGKSTMLNKLAGESRVIVSDIAGTTRDAVDVPVEFQGRRFIAIDTAGIMKRRKVADSIEFYTQARTEAAIRRADVVLFLFDPNLEVSQVDKKIAMQLVEEAKPCILVVNKWDLARDRITTEEFHEYLSMRLPGLHYVPVVFTSAIEGLNLAGAIDVAYDVYRQASIRVGTSELNKVVEDAFTRRRPGGKEGHRARIYYSTQVDRTPPTFIVFVNDPNLFPHNYQRYIENRLREAFEFEEIPLRVFFRGKETEE